MSSTSIKQENMRSSLTIITLHVKLNVIVVWFNKILWLIEELLFQNVDHKMKFRSKKGQLPFIELNGEEIADSTIILKDLSQKFDRDLDAGLTSQQRNVAHAMVSMLENHLVWVVMWWRTKYPDQVLKGYKVNLQHALGSRLPNGVLNFFFKFAFGRKVCILILNVYYWKL